MTTRRENASGRMDRIQVEQLARKAGLPQLLAVRIAEVVTATGLPDERREEVFRELVAHFEDGLAAGRTPEQLLEVFGDGRRTAELIRDAKRVVTPASLGGTGDRDSWLARLSRDARYAVRRLAARPAFTGIAVLSLALGIGANSAMFTVINDVILRKPAISHPEQLIEVYRSDRNFRYNVLSEPDIADFRREMTTLDGIASTKLSFAAFEAGGRTLKLTVEMISSEYFQVLGLRPLRGRLIEPADAPAPGQGSVVVLSERFWRRAFAADPSIVGRPIRLNGANYDVLGIVPAEYAGRLRAVPTDVFVPVMIIDQFDHTNDQLVNRGNSGTFLTGRLKAGVTFRQAETEVERVARDLKSRHLQGWQGDMSVTVLPKTDVIIYPPIDEVLLPVAGMLMLVVGLVLVIACANLAGFLLARAVDRRKEIAVRLALGATRGQLITQLLVETVLLALTGGVLGLVLGRLTLRAVLSNEFPLPVTIDLALPIDWRVTAFSVAVSVGAGILFGLIPALQSTRMELASVIRDETTGGGRQRWALRHLLVGGQVAVSMVLLVIAGLFIRSLDAARKIDPGFGSKPAAILWLNIPGGAASQESSQIADRLVRRFGEIPGVAAIGRTSWLHLDPLGTQGTEITVDGMEPPPGRTSFQVDRATIDSGYVGAIGLKLVAGRNLQPPDIDTVWRSALVNEAFAARYFPGRSALRRRFRSGGREVEIVGIVNTAKSRNLSEEPRPFIYAPMRRGGDDGPEWFVARTSGSAERLAAEMRRAATEVDQRLFAIQGGTLQAFIGAQSYPLKMGATALMAFAALAMVMACIGLYGAVSYAVAQRSREVGIRLSLGAGPDSVVRLLLWGGLRLVLSGAVVGLIAAVMVGRLIEGLLFGVKAFDPATLLVVPAMLVSVAAVAAWVPARRAGRISPVAALKAE